MDNEMITRRTFVGTMGALALAAGAGLVGCGGSRQEEAPVEDNTQTTSENEPVVIDETGDDADDTGESKSLIVLWSWSGNTLQMAERVSELSGAEIYRIEAADPYPGTDRYEECADRAKQEQDDGIFPEIANPVENWESYDTIFLGYPIWWYHLPMIVQGFVYDHDWTGKTVVPFNSHEGSGDAGTYDDLREMTGTTVLEGIAIRGGEVEDSLYLIDEWYANLDL